MHYTFKEITQSYTFEKKSVSSIWAKLVTRRLSFVITYILINLGFTANMVSILSMIDVVIGCILLSMGGKYLILGVIMILFWDVLDCTDGNIARVKKEANYMGEFIDAMSGYVACSIVFLSLGLASYHTTTLVDNSYIFIIIGALSSIADILTRLIHQKYTVTVYRFAVKNNKPLPNIKGNSSNEKTGLLNVLKYVMKTLGFSSLFMPLLILALITNRFDYLSLFYAIYLISGLIAVFIVYINRVQKATENMKKNATSSK